MNSVLIQGAGTSPDSSVVLTEAKLLGNEPDGPHNLWLSSQRGRENRVRS